MRIKTILGIIILITGIALLGVSFYIKNRVVEGQTQIAEAQDKVDTGKAIMSLNSVTREIGRGVAAAAQKKIEEAEAMATEYAKMAKQLQIGGIIVIVLGAAIILVGKRKTS
jgi:HAMP domain-containing protein